MLAIEGAGRQYDVRLELGWVRTKTGLGPLLPSTHRLT